MALALAGIRRKTEFSPNHVLNDLRIIQSTADVLARLGAQVRLYDESDLGAVAVDERCIFSMAQGPAGSSVLLGIEADDRLVINSPRSVMQCYRVNLIRSLAEGGVPFPASEIVSTAAALNRQTTGSRQEKTWVKRGDVHAVHKEDVTLAYNADEVVSILCDYHRRGITQAILQQHVEGDAVKFYAIRGEDFFDWYHLNGTRHTPFSVGRLRELADASAEILGLHVYGGDAIIDPEGGITIIDINDWPSFARVRDQAADHIARLIFRKAEQYVHERE